jgi:CHAD domain-containing protein
MMEFMLGNVRKPVRELRKSLKSLPSDPPIRDIHNLRTRTRRLEAIASAFMPEDERCTRRLMKTIKPLRKSAGEVRDMDVLVTKARTLSRHRRDESVERLLEHLQAIRTESAHQLLDVVARQRKDACRSLKRFARQIEKRFHAENPHAGPASKLIDELSHWPALSAENLHPFRLKVKELRYVLQLAEDANPDFVNALEKVKAQIGDWHDWLQLGKKAEKVLDPKNDRTTLEKIAAIEKRKFYRALNAASAMRKRYLHTHYGFAISEP